MENVSHNTSWSVNSQGDVPNATTFNDGDFVENENVEMSLSYVHDELPSASRGQSDNLLQTSLDMENT